MINMLFIVYIVYPFLVCILSCHKSLDIKTLFQSDLFHFCFKCVWSAVYKDDTARAWVHQRPTMIFSQRLSCIINKVFIKIIKMLFFMFISSTLIVIFCDHGLSCERPSLRRRPLETY